MEHIGIDLGSRDSQICIRNGAGEIVEGLRCRTDRLVPFLARRAPGRFVVETCTEVFRIAGTAARFVAALDQVDRFPNASSVASYLGLVPGEDTTGFRIKRKRLTRADIEKLAGALVERMSLNSDELRQLI